MKPLLRNAVFGFLLLLVSTSVFAGPCNTQHPTPENPTLILSLVGGGMIAWRYMRARVGR